MDIKSLVDEEKSEEQTLWDMQLEAGFHVLMVMDSSMRVVWKANDEFVENIVGRGKELAKKTENQEIGWQLAVTTALKNNSELRWTFEDTVKLCC